jgi:Phosphate-selective porin O and P
MKARASWIVGLFLLAGAAPAFAGFKLLDKEGKEKIDLGFRLQVLGIATDRDLDGDGDFERYEDFRIRRARFRLRGTINEHIGVFLQTDVSGNDIQMLDAYVHLTMNPGFQAFVGQHLAPSSRQAVTSSATLLAADRPNITYKSLTWGLRILDAFATSTHPDSDLGIRGSAQNRDVGATLFGVHDLGDDLHFKYQVGIYDGISAPDENSKRITGRLQLNLGDSEPSYYDTATYLGEKRTLAFGVSYDVQPNVGRVIDGELFKTDYAYWTVDVFGEQPVGSGSLTFEGAYANVDLKGLAPRLEGDGFYVQAGYLIHKARWQPWVLYEKWSADDPDGRGGFDSFRVGVSYFMVGHNANLKVGYETIRADTEIESTHEDTIDTFLVGLYITY